MKVDRRKSLRRFGAFVAGSPLAQGEPGGGAPPSDRLAPVLEMVNVPEFEAMARLSLPPARFETISVGRRTSFDKMTFRQRLMVYAMDLDLITRLFGYDMFAPIIVGPVANQSDLSIPTASWRPRAARRPPARSWWPRGSRAIPSTRSSRRATSRCGTAVLVARPPMWGLAAYGAEGSLATLDKQWKRRVEELPRPNDLARIFYRPQVDELVDALEALVTQTGGVPVILPARVSRWAGRRTLR